MTLGDFFGPPIHTYTRAYAIRDGVLVDVTTTAHEAGFRVPVALTAAAAHEAVTWDPAHGAHQDPTGRLWDVLTMAHLAATRGSDTDRAGFHVLRIPNQPGAELPVLTALDLHIGPGDDTEPVVTILLPGED